MTGKGNEGLEMEQVKPQEQGGLRTGRVTGRGDWGDNVRKRMRLKCCFPYS